MNIELRQCRCPIRPNMTYDELMKELYQARTYCTYDAGYICPTLDKEMRRADTERQRKIYIENRKKALADSN